MKKKILILCLSILCLCASAKQRVILITIDGLRSDILSNSSQPAPFLHEMMRKSVYVPNVIVVNPTMTYPSHTTLVTGSTPLDATVSSSLTGLSQHYTTGMPIAYAPRLFGRR